MPMPLEPGDSLAEDRHLGLVRGSVQLERFVMEDVAGNDIPIWTRAGSEIQRNLNRGVVGPIKMA